MALVGMSGSVDVETIQPQILCFGPMGRGLYISFSFLTSMLLRKAGGVVDR